MIIMYVCCNRVAVKPYPNFSVDPRREALQCFKIRATGVARLLCYILSSFGDFPCWTITYFIARVEGQTICKHSSWLIHFVLNKKRTENTVSLCLH